MGIFDKLFNGKNAISYEEAAKYWTTPPSTDPPEFPLMHYEYFPPVEVFIKFGIGDVVGDPDYSFYKWEDSARFVDSRGRVYKGEFNFGLMVPHRIERTLTVDEFKRIVIDVLNFQIKECRKEYYGLIEFVKQATSIKEIILRLSETYEE